jgi:hypothetical protein
MLASLFLFGAPAGTNTSILTRPISFERLRHFECFNIVRIIDHAVRDGKGAADVTTELTAHCAKLEDSRKNICTSLVPSKVAAITADVSNKTRPDVICEGLGYARPFGGSRQITAAQCAKYVELVRTELAAGGKDEKAHLPKPFKKREGELGRGVFGKVFAGSAACKGVEGDERFSCRVIARLISRALRSDVEKAKPASELCQNLGEKHLIKLVAEGAAEAKPQ